MPSVLESGKLGLSPDEVNRYRAAVDRLRQSCDMVIKLERPITVEEWMFLAVADAALRGDLKPLGGVIAIVEAEIESRKRRS
jgi:hypothetical protein